MSIFDQGTALEDVVGNLKICLTRKDFRRLKMRAKSLIVRYDNPVIIAYSDELDDEDLIQQTLQTIEGTDDPTTIQLLGDIINILIQRPKNLLKLVEYRVMEVIMSVVSRQTAKEVNFVTQLLNILVILLEFDDIRKLVKQAEILELLLPSMNTFSKDSEFLTICLKILRLCCNLKELVDHILQLGGTDQTIRAIRACFNKLEVAISGSAVIEKMLDDVMATRQLITMNVTSTLCGLLARFYENETAALSLTHCFRKLVLFKKARMEMSDANVATTLKDTIDKHSKGVLTIVQYAFMTLVFMSLSEEARESCRECEVESVMVKCIAAYPTNSGVVRDACIAIASLIFNPDDIIRYQQLKMTTAISKALKSFSNDKHIITLQVLVSVMKEASLYSICVPDIIQNGGIDALIHMFHTVFSDRKVVSIAMATLVKLSESTLSHEAFLKAKGDVQVPAMLSQYLGKNWVIVRSACLVLRNICKNDDCKIAVVEKDGHLHVFRAMMKYLKNCQSIVYVCLQTINNILSSKLIHPKMKEESIVRQLNVVEQRFHRTNRALCHLARDCMDMIATKESIPSASASSSTLKAVTPSQSSSKSSATPSTSSKPSSSTSSSSKDKDKDKDKATAPK